MLRIFSLSAAPSPVEPFYDRQGRVGPTNMRRGRHKDPESPTEAPPPAAPVRWVNRSHTFDDFYEGVFC